MARNLEAWEANNYFCSWLMQEVWNMEVLESLSRQYKEFCARKGKPYTRETLEDAMQEAVDDLANSIDNFLDDEFDEEDDE